MLTNLYLLIIIITIVQIILSKNLINKPTEHETAIELLNFIKRGDGDLMDANRMRSLFKNDAKYFDTIVETSVSSTTRRSDVSIKKRNPKNDKNYHEIKSLLTKLLDQITDIEKEKRDDKSTTTKVQQVSSESLYTTSAATNFKQSKKKKKEECTKKARWGHWTDWSSCSVSCGKGRQIRWRHCIEHCDEAETEMEEKACQLPACGPGKLFGVLQL